MPNAPDAAHLEWDFDSVPENERAGCCFHEYLREANLAGKYDRPWMSLSASEKKRLKRRYENLQRRKKHRAFTPETKPTESVLFQPVAFRVSRTNQIHVGWWTFSDREIIAAFKEWLKDARPKDSKPTKRGLTKNENQVPLERLAIVRLLSSATHAKLRTSQTPAGNFYRNRPEPRQDVRRAIAFFESLFPTLTREHHVTMRSLPKSKHAPRQKTKRSSV